MWRNWVLLPFKWIFAWESGLSTLFYWLSNSTLLRNIIILCINFITFKRLNLKTTFWRIFWLFSFLHAKKFFTGSRISNRPMKIATVRIAARNGRTLPPPTISWNVTSNKSSPSNKIRRRPRPTRSHEMYSFCVTSMLLLLCFSLNLYFLLSWK